MLQELKSREFHRIRPLLTGEQVNLEIRAIAATSSPGWIFVDDRVNPQTALVFSHGQSGFYFTGRENNPRFEAALVQTIENLRPRLAEMGIHDFEFSGTSEEWELALERIFVGKDLEKFTQHVYLFPDLRQVQLAETRPAENFQVTAISRELLASPEIDTSYIEKNLLDWWESLDNFLDQGYGYCVICEGKTVALCFASFVEDSNWALGVYTQAEYRKRGFAWAAGLKMIKYCQKHNIAPYWDCMGDNIPSRRLAKSLGFSLAFKYQVYGFRFI
ncbi:MAG: GNAT family N-acetyltransferase [Firmicutes bacterium]|nr:GNAT family N-acetyltransferase [Bacillota bacterium]